MSLLMLSEQMPVARKDYPCIASIWLREMGFHGTGTNLSFTEFRSIIKARSHGWKILKGEKYVKQNNIQDGKMVVYRAIPEIHEICLKFDCYSDC